MKFARKRNVPTPFSHGGLEISITLHQTESMAGNREHKARSGRIQCMLSHQHNQLVCLQPSEPSRNLS